jgi:hypothetical protein
MPTHRARDTSTAAPPWAAPRAHPRHGQRERPPEVADRAVPGHWEGDLILGSTESGSAIGTLIERSTQFVMLLHLPDNHGALAVQEAIVDKMAQLPGHPAPHPDLGPRQRNGQPRSDRRGCRSRHLLLRSALTLTAHRGSAAPTNTPTARCANGLPKAKSCRCSRPTSWTTWLPNSTADPAKPNPGLENPPPKPSTNYCPTHQNHPLLYPPPETARDLSSRF